MKQEKRWKSLLIFLILFITHIILKCLFADSVKVSGKSDFVWCASKCYCVGNNVWNPDENWKQTIEVDEQNGNFVIAEANHNKPENSAPAAYPHIFKGNHWGTVTENSGMPKQVQMINKVNSKWKISSVSSGVWNAALDIWFHKTENYKEGSPNGLEMMIWINYLGSIQPAGVKIDTISLAGSNWEVWGKKGSPNYIAYRRIEKTSSFDANLKPFFDDAVSRGFLEKTWFLVSIEAGFELWQGGTGLKSFEFSVSEF